MGESSFQHGLGVLEARSRNAIRAIWIVIIVSFAVMACDAAIVVGMIDFANPDASLLYFYSAVYFGYVAVFLLSVVLVAMWIHRAHSNLRDAGLIDLEYTPGWAIGWFFVPVANLFKPFQAMRELWNASHGTSNGYAEESPPNVKVWWGCWIAGNIVSYISLRIELNAGPDGAAGAALASVVGTALSLASAWFLLQIIREVLAAQQSYLNASEAFS